MGDEPPRQPEALKDLDDDDLLRRASALAPDLDTDDGDEDPYWTVIHELHRRGTRLIFEEAVWLTVSEDPAARRLACDVLGQLGYEHGRPFGIQTFPVLARLCTEEAVSPVLASAIAAMGNLGRPESLPYVVAHDRHPDCDVRFAVACALPSIAGVEWLEPTHPAVTTLMELTSDEDADVRDWATFGLGSQLMVDGVEVRQCLFARVDDPDEDTRVEAVAGLARRHTPGIARHIRDALAAEAVGRQTVAAAASLGDPSLAEPLTRLVGRWDVDVDLLEGARRRCEPKRIDATVQLVSELLDAAEVKDLRLIVASELLDDTGEPDVHVVGAGTPRAYSLEALMRRAGGSVDAAVRLIQHDLHQPQPIPAPPEASVATAVSDYTSRAAHRSTQE